MCDVCRSDTVETKGPSKKELAKMKRKEQKASHKTGGASDAAEKAPAEKAVKSINLYYCAESTPEITFAIIGILGVQSSVATHVTKTPSQAFVPYITYDATGGDMSTETLSGDVNISKFLLRNASEFTSPVAYMNLDPFTTSQMDQWCSDLSCIDVNVLNTHLSTRTFLVDDAIGLSLADIAVFTTLRKRLGSAVIEAATFPHVIRWGLLLDALLKPYPSMREVLTATIVKTVKPVVAKKENTKKVESKGKDTEEKDGAICPELEGATEGNVCTRFPPEPSGYLHIGHAKACLLNQYYAQRYKGKLIIRFDDTNPNKEKDEFEQAIIADLERLGVVGDVVTHTSDSFDKIQKV